MQESKFYTDHIQQIRNKSENYDNPEEPKQLRQAPISQFEYITYSLLMHINDNIVDTVSRDQNFHQ